MSAEVKTDHVAAAGNNLLDFQAALTKTFGPAKDPQFCDNPRYGNMPYAILVWGTVAAAVGAADPNAPLS